MTKEEVLSKLRDDLSILQREYNVSKIGIFGSYASNDQKDSSDVDIIVKFERPIGFKLFELIDLLESRLGKNRYNYRCRSEGDKS